MSKFSESLSEPFILSSEEKSLHVEFQKWLKKNLPSARERQLWDASDWATRWEASKRWQKKLSDGGWMGISWPQKYGGRGISHIAEFLIGEELAAVGAPYSGNWISLAAIGQALLALGTEAQKRQYLPPIAQGTDSWCLGVTEEISGSNVMATATKAVDVGDCFIVNGKKIWSTHSPYASRCLLLTKTNTSRRAEFGMTMLIVDLKSPGVFIRPIRQLQGETNYGEIIFQDVRVPKENVVGKVDGGWAVQVTTWLAESLPPWDIPHRMGIRPLVKLARRQKIKTGTAAAHKLAELIVDAEMVRLTSVRALRAERPGHFLRGTTPLVKVAFTETTQKITEAGMEWCPDEERSFWDGSPESWLYRHISARSNTIARAPSELHRNFIAHFTLGLPK